VRFDIAVALTTFGIILPAELPDKTAVASVLLGARYHRPLWAFAGTAAAFTVHVVLAVTAGTLLTLLPRRPVEVIVAVLFAFGAVMLLRGKPEEESKEVETEPTFWRIAGTSFTVILIAEFGDLTQILIANFAARYNQPLSVGAGGLAALLTAAGVGIAGGRVLLRVLPIVWITRAAAVAMLVLAGFSLASAIRGLRSWALRQPGVSYRGAW
jgi:Ca2+/H+ antiporter, TMEM165/GDT1 family